LTGTDPTVRPRAVHLLEYLKAVRDLKEQPVGDIADYRDDRWWAGDIPDHPACAVTSTGDGPWLRVSKAQVPTPPDSPQEIRPYLQTRVDDPWHQPVFASDFRPRVREQVRQRLNTPGPPAADRLEAETQLEADRLGSALRSYVDGPWSAWAELAKPTQRARTLYDRLFELRQRLQRDSALIELVWGHGILCWVAPDGTRIVHPLVTSQVQVAFDSDTGTISVELEAFVPHRMEIDMLQALRLPGFDLLVKAQEEFRVSPVGPFDPEAGPLYEKLVATLGQDGQVIEADVPRPAGPVPTITASWALMVRRRSAMYKRFFTSLHDALTSGEMEVPAPLVAVVADEPGKLDRDALASDDGARSQMPERLLMPLPTNPEQEAVARRLAENRGVTVQGPPGTGKTHTIANLISHLVGHGKRVLVTSQKEQALSVLRDKVPESIRDLSVSVLGSSATSLAQLDQSVQAIYEQAVGLDRGPARQRVKDLDERLTQTQREIGALRNRIAASIAREWDSYTMADGSNRPGEYSGPATYTPSTLGQWLTDNEAELSYIPDELAPGTSCPLTTAEFTDLFRLARGISKADRAGARLALPPAQDLPAPAALASAAAELRDVRDRLAGTESAISDRLALERLTPDELSALTESVAQATVQLRQLEEPWLAMIRQELRDASFAAMWRDQKKAIREGIEELSAYGMRLSGHVVDLPGEGLPTKELLELLGQIRDRYAEGKGINKTFQKDLYRTREACRVDQESPTTVEDVDLCIMEARSRRRRYELIRRWNDAVARVGGPLVDAAAGYPEYQLAERVDRIEGAFGWEEGGWDNLRDRLRAAGTRAPLIPTSRDLAALAETLRVAALHVREKQLAGWLDSVGKFLADGKALPGASYLCAHLLDAFTEQAWERWGQIVDEIRRLNGLVADVARFDDLVRRLAQVAPVWARQIFDSAESETGAETALRAWEWRQADTWLRAIMSADNPAVLQRQLEEKMRQESRLTADLAAQSAWLGLADRLTDRERMALTAWVGALRKVGKGYGKYAAHWRAEAQKAMRDAQGAVPVWIMPTHRVVESFDATTARFDVVIVDESSQCDLFGLAALSLADKAVIVGDDKQISPSAIGTEESAVHELIRHYIPDVPQSGLLDIKSSLYDMAKMRFPGVIMLREHFRCLPEIIEFSNGLCYGGKIMPLREQPADPSWRSVVDIFLEDGFREKGTDTNVAEASFIVEKIASLCAEPAYDGKTFGVISLIGDAQAGLIESRLVDRLGEKEMERRQIRCGNAYHFQGDERDVMFLSLVAAAGEGRRIGAMTKEADRQRINVAASRARDQMWCVRSVSLEELHPDDMRAALIRHCQNPGLVSAAVEDVEAAGGFDSDFERSVYRRIVARGYRVKTQYHVGRYRIDQVIEGSGASGGRRLALELDGDAYHGPDRFEADRDRQAILERLGWTFHRIRGSAYYRDPDEAMSFLWERLENLDIRPAGGRFEIGTNTPLKEELTNRYLTCQQNAENAGR
jgi:very-short-patch-repair endonuclease